MQRTPVFRPAPAAAALLAVLTIAVTVAGCGGAKPKSSASAYASALKYAQCMRTHGVPQFPDPSAGGGGIGIQASQNGAGTTIKVNGVSVDAPAFQSAQQKCQADMPGGGTVPPQAVAALRARMLKAAECMRSHGVPNYPDPQVSTGPGGHGIAVKVGAPGLDLSGPVVQQAEKECGGPRSGLRPVQVLGAGPGPKTGAPSSAAGGS